MQCEVNHHRVDYYPCGAGMRGQGPDEFSRILERDGWRQEGFFTEIIRSAAFIFRLHHEGATEENPDAGTGIRDR